jgi:signal transduction histidine kinase
VYLEIDKHRATLDSAKGDYYHALIRKSLHNKIKDSLLNEKLNKQVIELQTKYETDKKQSQIEQLTAQNTIQSLNLKNQILALNASELQNEKSILDISNKNLALKHKNITIQQIELSAKNDQQKISLLNEKTLVQNLQIKNKNQTIIIISALFAVLAISATAGLILFKNFRAKAKIKQEQLALENKLLEEQANAKIQEQRLEISRELHDSLGAQLTFISSILDGIKKSSIDNEKVIRKINTLSDLSENSTNELKNTIWALNAKELKLEDLKLKLLNFIKSAADAKEDTKFNFEIAKNFQLNSKQAINLFRVFQEIINNSLKYANAKNISATIKQSKNTLAIEITDDGVGFNISEVENKSFGISNIRSRIGEINGDIKIDTAPKLGTKYYIQISLT